MKFVACKRSDFRKGTKSDVRGLLMSIIESGEPYVEIKDFEHRDAHTCKNSLDAVIKRDRFKQLEVTTDKGRVFVINTLIAKD